jgi:hypothetical protein
VQLPKLSLLQEAPEVDPASSSKISSRSLERTSDYSPESAARHVRRIQEADRTRKPPGSRDIISEHDALVQWTDESGRIIPDSYIEDRIYRGEIVYRDEGAEHEVYHDERGERAVKVTQCSCLNIWIDLLSPITFSATMCSSLVPGIIRSP